MIHLWSSSVVRWHEWFNLNMQPFVCLVFYLVGCAVYEGKKS